MVSNESLRVHFRQPRGLPFHWPFAASCALAEEGPALELHTWCFLGGKGSGLVAPKGGDVDM